MTATTPSSKSITVSIVSHGQQALIVPLLAQLAHLCETAVAKVILTVNVEEAELVGDATYSFPLERIDNVRARGFGANHNAAFQHCTTPWFLVLNPDIRIDRDVLGELLTSAQASDGVLTPRIMEPGKSSLEPHRGMLTLCDVLLRHRTGYRAPKHPAWIPGMFMLFRTEVFRNIGGFDERFFMYGEDFDICARLRLAGWRIHVAEDMKVLHAAQRASRRNWRHLRWHFTSLAKVWCSETFWRYRDLNQHSLNSN